VRRAAKYLTDDQRAANEALLATLDAIPRRLHQASR
jgi:hypothetical protein